MLGAEEEAARGTSIIGPWSSISWTTTGARRTVARASPSASTSMPCSSKNSVEVEEPVVDRVPLLARQRRGDARARLRPSEVLDLLLLDLVAELEVEDPDVDSTPDRSAFSGREKYSSSARDGGPRRRGRSTRAPSTYLAYTYSWRARICSSTRGGLPSGRSTGRVIPRRTPEHRLGHRAGATKRGAPVPARSGPADVRRRGAHEAACRSSSAVSHADRAPGAHAAHCPRAPPGRPRKRLRAAGRSDERRPTQRLATISSIETSRVSDGPRDASGIHGVASRASEEPYPRAPSTSRQGGGPIDTRHPAKTRIGTALAAEVSGPFTRSDEP